MNSVASLQVFDPMGLVYSPYGGNFRSLRTPTWHTCRVTFHDKHHKLLESNHFDAFFYVCNSNQNVDMVTKVVRAIEERLELKTENKVNFTKFGSHQNVLYIETSKWWSDPIRFNILTAFLKDSLDDNVDEAIKDGYLYLAATKNALYHFLDGNVYYHGDLFEGWVTDFSDKGIGHNSIRHLKKKPCKDKTIEIRYYPGWTKYTVELNGEN